MASASKSAVQLLADQCSHNTPATQVECTTPSQFCNEQKHGHQHWHVHVRRSHLINRFRVLQANDHASIESRWLTMQLATALRRPSAHQWGLKAYQQLRPRGPARLRISQAAPQHHFLSPSRQHLVQANPTDKTFGDHSASTGGPGPDADRNQLSGLHRLLLGTALVLTVTLTSAGSAQAAASRRLALGTAAATSAVQTTPSRTSSSFSTSVAVSQPSAWAVAQYQFSKVSGNTGVPGAQIWHTLSCWVCQYAMNCLSKQQQSSKSLPSKTCCMMHSLCTYPRAINVVPNMPSPCA